MNPIVIHIGLTKTGTSSLQSFLNGQPDALARASFVYPEAGRGSEPRKAHHNLYYETRVSGRGNGTFDPARGGWREALREVDTFENRTGIISSEGFQYSTVEEVPRIAEILEGRQVTVVAYLRRHDRWLESAWNQRARFGRVSLRFADFLEEVGKEIGDYARTLGPWLDAFGDKNVDVRIYDEIAKSPGIVGDFTVTYAGGLDPAVLGNTAVRRNSKAGLKHVIAVSAVTSACREKLGEDFSLSRRSAERISSFFRDRTDDHDYSVLSFDDAIAIARFFRGSDERLACASTSFKLSGPFLAPQPGDFQNHVDLSDPSALFAEQFDQEERRFVGRMAREIVKATTLPAVATL